MSALKRLGELGRTEGKRSLLVHHAKKGPNLFLPITEDEINNSPEKVCLTLGAYMLIPHDPASRYWYMFKKKHGNLLGFGSKNSMQSWQKSLESSEFANIVEQVPEFARYLPGKELQIAGRHGLISGYILRDFVVFNLAKSNKRTLGETKAHWANIYKNARVSESTINTTILPKFKPVCHLWAAHLVLLQHYGDEDFPCNPNNLPCFLSLSEEYRRLGETLFPKRRQRAFLNKSETFKVPSGIKLPTTRIPGLEL